MCQQNEAIYSEDYKGYQIRIENDKDAESPRTFDNLGVMVCEHSRYNLGDGYENKATGRWVGGVDFWQEKEAPVLTEKTEDGEYIDLEPKEAFLAFVQRKDVVALPLYLLDHSGLWMRTGKFAEDSGGWDTSMVGWIYIAHQRIKEEMAMPVGKGKSQKLTAIKKITPGVVARAEALLESEVATYNDYLVGDVFGYVVEKDGEDVDSCWGFYPEHSVLRGAEDYDYCLKEARGVVDWKIKEAKK